jgi:hypothetical protein
MNRSRAGEYILSVASKSLFALAGSAPTFEQWLQRARASYNLSVAKFHPEGKSEQNAKSQQNMSTMSPSDIGAKKSRLPGSSESLNDFLESIGFRTLPLPKRANPKRCKSPLTPEAMSGIGRPASATIDRTIDVTTAGLPVANISRSTRSKLDKRSKQDRAESDSNQKVKPVGMNEPSKSNEAPGVVAGGQLSRPTKARGSRRKSASMIDNINSCGANCTTARVS